MAGFSRPLCLSTTVVHVFQRHTASSPPPHPPQPLDPPSLLHALYFNHPITAFGPPSTISFLSSLLLHTVLQRHTASSPPPHPPQPLGPPSLLHALYFNRPITAFGPPSFLASPTLSVPLLLARHTNHILAYCCYGARVIQEDSRVVKISDLAWIQTLC
jgi:hypothetical protein